MKVATKLTIVFLLLSLIPLTIVAYLAFDNSRQTIEQNTTSRLISTAILKEAEFNRWIENNERQLRELARRPLVRDFAVVLAGQDQATEAYRTAYSSLLIDHFTPTLEEKAGYLELSLLHPQTGRIMASTNPTIEGMFRESEPFYINGQEGTYVDNVRYSLQAEAAVLNLSTPVKDKNGRLLAVLAGHVDLTEMTEIMQLESGLSRSEDSYLINHFNFFVTEPKFGPDFALKKAVQTEGIENCLAGQSDVGFYPDYRGIPVIGAYRWLPEHKLCLITEIDQAEAFAPIRQLQTVILGTGGGIALVVAVLGLVLARTITNPVKQLVKGAAEFGQGNLDYRIEVASQDEIGDLATAFNQMAARRKQTEQTLREQQDFLQSIYQGADLAVFVIDVTEDNDFRFAGLNPAHERISGMKSEEVRGKTPEELTPFLPPEAAAAVRANYSRCLEAGQSIGYEEMIPMGGQEIWWLTKLTPLRNSNQRTYRIVGTALEITARKQMEEKLRQARDELEQRVQDRTLALQESEAKYRQLAETAQDIIITHSMTGKITYVNPVGLTLTGFSEEELLRTPIVDLVLDDEETERMKARRERRAAGDDTVFRYETELVTKSGRRVPLDVVSSLILSDGEPSDVLILARDITERRQAEAKLKSSEERFKALIQNSSDLITIIDADGVIQFESPSLEPLLGYRPEEVLGRPVFELLHPDDRPVVQEAIAQVLQTEGDTAHATIRYRHKDGSWRTFEGPGQNLLHHPAIRGIVVNARDITERREAELALEENERNLRRAQRIAHLGSWEMDIATGESEWSDEFFRICGFEPGAVKPTAELGYEMIHPDDREAAAAAVQKTLENGQDYLIEKRIVRPDGEVRYILSQGELVYDENEQAAKLARTFLDITGRKQAELALAQKAEDLARSNADLQQFAYVASHDLQEPLRMITSYLQLIELRYSDALDQDGHEFIAYAVDGANRMKKLINGLLEYSRVGTRGEALVPTDCEEILADVLDNLKFAILDQEATISHEPLPTVLADGRQLEQVFQNLISNGLKFHNSKPVQIHIGAEQQNREWLFSIRDNGIGLEPQFAERIFVIFQRLHNIEDYPGTGMGLAICKKIIERHGGRIWVESQLEQGATFYFTLPILSGKKERLR